MCFSAGASFGASAVLGVVSIASLKNVTTPAQVPFAAIPLLFSIQQAAEGMLWIGLSGTDHTSWQHFPVYIFLIFAQLVWPIWIPFSILLVEKERIRKKILLLFLVIGIIISLYLLYCMVVYDVKAEIHSEHIRYTLNFPLAFALISNIFYFIPTIVPLFVSSFKMMWLLGGAILSSLIITKIYFEEHLISVWCFFGALISIAILAIVMMFKRSRSGPEGSQ